MIILDDVLSSIIIVITLLKIIITIKQSVPGVFFQPAGVQFEFKTLYRSSDQNQLVDIVSVCTRQSSVIAVGSCHPHLYNV